jgi:hypothetical protein
VRLESSFSVQGAPEAAWDLLRDVSSAVAYRTASATRTWHSSLRLPTDAAGAEARPGVRVGAAAKAAAR